MRAKAVDFLTVLIFFLLFSTILLVKISSLISVVFYYLISMVEKSVLLSSPFFDVISLVFDIEKIK